MATLGCRFDSDGGNYNRYVRKSGSKLRSQDLRLWIKRKKCVLAKPTSDIMFARLRPEVRSRKPCFSKRGFRPHARALAMADSGGARNDVPTLPSDLVERPSTVIPLHAKVAQPGQIVIQVRLKIGWSVVSRRVLTPLPEGPPQDPMGERPPPPREGHLSIRPASHCRATAPI
jgi:hypothetical protein